MCLGQLDEPWLCKIWVVFDLQGGDGVSVVSEEIVEAPSLEVTDTDGASDALVNGYLQ